MNVDRNIREAELDADTEEDLLRLQEEFLAQNSKPAAKVTRIGAGAVPEAAAGHPAPAPRAPVRPTAPIHVTHQNEDEDMWDDVLDGSVTETVPPARGGALASRGGVGPGLRITPGVGPQGPRGDSVGVPGTPGAPGSGSKEAVGAAAAAAAAARPEHEAEEHPAIIGRIDGLLGDIVERSGAVQPSSSSSTSGSGGSGDGDSREPNGHGLPAPGAAPAPFPAATHRKMSKFALSRKKPGAPGAAAPQTAPAAQEPLPHTQPGPAQPHTSTTAATTRPAGKRLQIPPAAGHTTTTVSAAGPTAPAGGDPRAGGGLSGLSGASPSEELSAIDALNRQAVLSMQPDQVAAAVDELAGRLAPGALEFLRRRGAQRLAQGTAAAAQQEAGVQQRRNHGQVQGESAAVGAPTVRMGGEAGAGEGLLGPRGPRGGGRVRDLLAATGQGAAEAASCASQADTNALLDGALRAITEGRAGGVSAAAAAPDSALGATPIEALVRQQQQQQQQQQGTTGAGSAPVAAGSGQGPGPGQQGAGGTPADPRLVARLRFDMGGVVVGVQAPDDTFREEEVLMRDQLRRDEGSAPLGYTLGELLVLCRSAVAAQRVAGLTLIAELCCMARPRAEDLRMHAPAAAAGAGKQGQQDGAGWGPGQMLYRFVPIPEELRDSAPACSVSWQEVWQFLVSELGLAAHLRLALDDDRPNVQAAAAAALAALLGRSESELLAAELADACPATGWPSPAYGYLTRAGVTAPWEAQPPACPDPHPQQQGGPGDEGPDAPEDVALVDPLAGALQMGLLQRIRYLLVARKSPGATLPLLAVLCAAARGGADVALSVCRERGLLAAVGELLDPAAALLPEQGADREAGEGAGGATGQGDATGAGAAAEGAERRAAAGRSGTAASVGAGAGLGLGPASAAHVAAVMLVRLLCCASPVAAQLVRTAGLLAPMTAYIALAGPPGAAASLHAQLLRLEALRTWRACAHHSIALTTVDDMYGNLCDLLLPPVRQSGSEVAAGSAASALTTLRQLSSGEVYCLLCTLVKHSVAVEQGDATLGRSMLGPGAAAALAQEALQWLGPGALRAVAAAALSRCSLSLPLLAAPSGGGSGGGGPSGSLLRALLGAHPALLVPEAVAHVACLSAVLSYLGAYWWSVAEGQDVFGQVRAALAASGLAGQAEPYKHRPTQQQQKQEGKSEKVDSGAAAGAGAGPQVELSPADALAMALLRRPQHGAAQQCSNGAAVPEAGAGGQEGGVVGRHDEVDPVGRALAGWALALVGGRPAVGAEGGRSDTVEAASGGGLRTEALVHRCLQAAAASLVYGTLQLTLAVHRSARAAPLASAVVLLAAPRCAQAALALPAACGRVLCPWHVAAQQQQLHLSRLVVLAATLLQPHMQQQQQPQHLAAAGSGTVPEGGEDGGKGTKAAPAAAAAQAGVLPVPPLVLMDTCLSVLSHAPAGAEALCLQALRLALCGELLRPLLQLAHKEAAALASAHPQLALAAAGVPNGSSTGSAGAGGLTGVLFSAPYPLPPGPPDADEAAEVLFESFAASWLSLIAQRRLEGGANQRRAGGSEAEGVEEGQQQGRARPAARVQLAPLTLGLCQLQQQAGSRLAAPPQWMMLEAHRLPATGGGGQQQHATPPPLHPVGCALMLCLGMEAAPGGSQLLRGLPAGSKEAAALQAAFVFRAGEMLAEEQRQQGRGRGPRGQGGDGDGDADESWREPLVRWALAGLSQRYLCKGGGSAVHLPGPQAPPAPYGRPGPLPPAPPASAAWLPGPLAERLGELLAAASWGDPLLGAHLALALRPEAHPVVRLQVWNALAMEKALQLLPPLPRCLGGPQQYLLLPPPLRPGAAQGATPASAPDPAFLAAAHKSLIEGELDKSMQPHQEHHQQGQQEQGQQAEPGLHAGGGGRGSGDQGWAWRCSMAGEVALSHLARWLLVREAWPALDAALGDAVEAARGTGGAGGDGGGGGRRVPAGAAMLGGLVRHAKAEAVAQLLLFAERWCGVAREEGAAVVTQTCSGGDVELRERARQVLAAAGLA